jgi:hypothetical protein
MGRQKGFNTNKLKEENRMKREIIELEKILIRDRQFFSTYTNEEFIEYELTRIEGITKKFLIKFLKKYGYIKTNTGSVRIDDRESVINIYSTIANSSK